MRVRLVHWNASEGRERQLKLGVKPGMKVAMLGAPPKFASTLPGVRDLLGERSVWFAWPKKSSGVATELNDNIVREAGLAAGLVGYKVCSIDSTWSGALFRRRR